ncbi:hypothetical protein [Actinomadura sp. 9N215]|uniref:hypothetical protein n=1 Tax=Actinomadura sp. 9N215 TaxID=3375150 RepID=UPI00379190E4
MDNPTAHTGGTRAAQTAGQPKEATRPYDESRNALEDLQGALDAAGVKLPSLGLENGPVIGSRTPLIELGRCNIETARKLAEVIRRGAEA